MNKKLLKSLVFCGIIFAFFFLVSIARASSGNVWVANYSSNNVTELSPTGSVIGTYPVGSGPIGIAAKYISPVRSGKNGSNKREINLWKNQNSGTSKNLFAIAYGNNEFVAVGEDGRILTSSDGTNWTVHNLVLL